MRTYGNVPGRFWIEAKEKGLSDDGRQLMVYLMSCHHGNSIGCFRMPVAYIADDLGWDFERVSSTLSETVSKGFLERDEERSWNRLPNHFETVSVSNPNVAKGMEPFIEAVPKDSPIFKSLLKSLQPFAKRFRNGYLNRLANGFETEAVASSSSSKEDLFTHLPPELNAARGGAVDNSRPPLDLSDVKVAGVVVSQMLGRRRLSPNDQQVLAAWCRSYDLENTVLPWLEGRVKNHVDLNGELPAHPLKYFSAGLSEHLARIGIKY